MQDRGVICSPSKTAANAPTSMGSPRAVPVPCISMLDTSGPAVFASAIASLKTCKISVSIPVFKLIN